VTEGAVAVVDGEFLKVDPEARDLSVKIGEVAALEKRII
jgi:hypothetical protein